MQHDAIAAAAYGMPEADRAAIDVEPGRIDLPGRAVEPQNLTAEFFFVPGGQAPQHWRRDRLVQFPRLDIPERQFVALQEFGRRQHRAQAHDRGIERGPLAVDDHGLWRQTVLFDRVFGRKDGTGCAIGELRGIAGGDLTPGPLEYRLKLCEALRRRVRPHAVVVIVEFAVARDRGFVLAHEPDLAL